MPVTTAKLPFTIRSSPTHGRGAFASRDIRKGARIVEYRGARTSWEEALGRPQSDPDDPHHTFLFELSDGITVIDARVGGNKARWNNHGCDPNCEAIEDDKCRVFIYAKRRIYPGEELTYDYGLTIDKRITKRKRKQFACYCGAESCRGTMLQVADAT